MLDDLERDSPEAFSGVLTSLGLSHLITVLSAETIGGCFLQLEDRVALLRHFQELGVKQLNERQKLVNALSTMRRQHPHAAIIPDGDLPVLWAPLLGDEAGHPAGSQGVLFAAEGGAAHVNGRAPRRFDDGTHRQCAALRRMRGSVLTCPSTSRRLPTRVVCNLKFVLCEV